MDGWRENEKLVLHQLDQLNQAVRELDKKHDKLHSDMVALKTKSKMWGAITGFVVSLIIALLDIFYKNSH